VTSHYLSRISEAGVSIWLDDLSRERFESDRADSLVELMANRSVVGVTTNPAIFSQAISRSSLYRGDLARFAREGISAAEAIERLTISDVKRAAELFESTFRNSGGKDGRVSIEVDPQLARDTEATIDQSHHLWEELGLPNILIKVPATVEGLVAIEELTRMGISVNVTLIFTAHRYDRVIDAYFSGLERRLAEGGAIDQIHSVASFFVSRIDTEIDARLERALEPERFAMLRGRAGISNALLAYQLFHDRINTERWHRLQAHGAQLQRPLWASTGVKDPSYPATLYVESLITGDSVNTMPEVTLEATARLKDDHPIDMVKPSSSQIDRAKTHLSDLEEMGIEINQVGEKLESEGLEKFLTPWQALQQRISDEMKS
jgi:transaldolase